MHASPKGEGWTKPTELAELIDIDPDTRAALGDHLPSLRFLLDDLTTLDVAALRARDLTAQAPDNAGPSEDRRGQQTPPKAKPQAKPEGAVRLYSSNLR
ncbi:hypothetical protein ACWCW7_00295 [Nocardia tengchongensis]